MYLEYNLTDWYYITAIISLKNMFLETQTLLLCLYGYVKHCYVIIRTNLQRLCSFMSSNAWDDKSPSSVHQQQNNNKYYLRSNETCIPYNSVEFSHALIQ